MVAVSLKKNFLKQKTAYAIMSGDWSSDVCSSDLLAAALSAIHQRYGTVDAWLAAEYQLTAPVRAALKARLLEE